MNIEQFKTILFEELNKAAPEFRQALEKTLDPYKLWDGKFDVNDLVVCDLEKIAFHAGITRLNLVTQFGIGGLVITARYNKSKCHIESFDMSIQVPKIDDSWQVIHANRVYRESSNAKLLSTEKGVRKLLSTKLKELTKEVAEIQSSTSPLFYSLMRTAARTRAVAAMHRQAAPSHITTEIYETSARLAELLKVYFSDKCTTDVNTRFYIS